VKRQQTTIYFSDYESPFEGGSQIKVVTREDSGAELALMLRYMDAYNSTHLPFRNDGVLQPSRRVAAERHDRNINCLYFDGHAGRMETMKMTVRDWGRFLDQ
jgi:prepilin-type processing-associated H-X9-DG protein